MELFKGLPTWAKGTIALVVTAGVVTSVYFGIRGIKKLIQNIDNKNNKDEVNASEDELTRLNKNSSTKQKMTKVQAESFANAIDTMMNGYGTDSQGIKDIFYKVSNDADVLAIINAFGVRTISSGNLNPEPDFKGTLSGALREELNSDWINLINKVLSDKKITYRF
jgi:hypothetical protein